jgi:hypothetical protein
VAVRTAISGAMLAFITLLAVAQEPVAANHTRSLHVPTFQAKDGSFTTQAVAGTRNLSLYDDAGHFDCRRFTREAIYKKPEEEKARIASSMEDARAFIWEHWKSKKRGYIQITFNSVDATSTSHIFIEPYTSSVWQVTWRIVRHNNHVDDLPPIRIIERKRVGEETVLVFNAADGNEQETL